MAKTRLTQSMRQALKQYARKALSEAEDTATVDSTYNVAAQLVKTHVESLFPPKDMEVLAKYNACYRDACVNNHRSFTFAFYEQRYAPRVPRDGNSCSTREYAFDAATKAAIERYNLAVSLRNDKVEAKLRDYVSLIYSARTFEDVTDVWAAAEVLRSQLHIATNSLVAVNADVLARIRDSNVKLAA